MQSLERNAAHNIGYWKRCPIWDWAWGHLLIMDGCRFSNEKDLRRYLALDLEHDCGEG